MSWPPDLYFLTETQFYSFRAEISMQTSISSFIVQVTRADGKTQLYDNNAEGFPISDDVMVQTPQSCVNSGKLNILAAVWPSVTQHTIRMLTCYNLDPKQHNNTCRIDLNAESAEKRREPYSIACTFSRLFISKNGTRRFHRSIHVVQW